MSQIIWPVIDFNNIIAIGALIVATASSVFSAMIFRHTVNAFDANYSRNRLSEQNKIVSDIYIDKISEDYRKLHEFDPENQYPTSGTDKEQWKFIKEFTRRLGFILDDIIYLSHLKETKEIENREVVNFLSPRLLKILRYIDEQYNFVEKKPQKNIMNTTWAGYHAEIPRLKRIWET